MHVQVENMALGCWIHSNRSYGASPFSTDLILRRLSRKWCSARFRAKRYRTIPKVDPWPRLENLRVVLRMFRMSAWRVTTLNTTRVRHMLSEVLMNHVTINGEMNEDHPQRQRRCRAQCFSPRDASRCLPSRGQRCVHCVSTAQVVTPSRCCTFILRHMRKFVKTSTRSHRASQDGAWNDTKRCPGRACCREPKHLWTCIP